MASVCTCVRVECECVSVRVMDRESVIGFGGKVLPPPPLVTTTATVRVVSEKVEVAVSFVTEESVSELLCKATSKATLIELPQTCLVSKGNP